jgi:hypothetical protein
LKVHAIARIKKISAKWSTLQKTQFVCGEENTININTINIVSVFFSWSRRENMGVLCLFVQEQRSKINLFLHSNDELSPYQTLLISKHFSKYIQKITDARYVGFLLL